MHPFFFFSGILWTSALLGFLLRHFAGATRQTAQAIMRMLVLVFTTVVFVVSGWGLDVHSLGRDGAMMPLIGACVSLSCLYVSNRYAVRKGLPTSLRASFISSCSVSNVGVTYGIPACFILFGLTGQALAGAYTLYHSLFVFAVLASVASHLRAADEQKTLSVRSLIGDFFRDPFRMVPIASFGLGFLLQAAFTSDGIPAWLLVLNRVWIHAALFFSFLAVGMLLDVHSFRRHFPLLKVLFAVKFLLAPVVAFLSALVLGMHDVSLLVVMIEGSAPVAVMAVVLMAIYDMDSEFASLALLTSTVAANVVLGVVVMVQ